MKQRSEPHSEPFWEATYRSREKDAFGSPSEEIRDLATRLAPGTRVLDAGCGEGRNALFLAEQGFDVRAFDISEAAIAKTQYRAKTRGLSLEAWTADFSDFEFDRDYDLILSHGVLHLLDVEVCERFLMAAREHTRPGGTHVHVVFTDAIAPPADLAPFVRHLFREGELRDLFSDWQIEIFSSYTKHDQHPGSEPHRHPINKLVARKPESSTSC